MDNEFMENYNSEPSNKHKKEKSILKKIYKSLINIFAVMGLGGAKIAAAVLLLLIKFLRAVGYVIAEIFKGVWTLICLVVSILISPFKERMDATADLQKSVRNAKKQGGKEYKKEIVKSSFIYLFGENGMFYTAFNYILPILSVAFFIGVVKYGSGLEYGICVEYNGKEIGVISDESEYDEAAREVHQRVSYVNGKEAVQFSPKLSLKIVSDDEQYYNSVQLANKLLSESERELTEAYGIYIDGEFIGAVKNKTPVEDALTDVLVNYKADGNIRNIAFKNKVEYNHGIYLADSIVSEDDAIKKLTASKKNKAVYVAQTGDSALVICQKFNMELEEFYELNPYAADGISQGNILTVTETESFLPIQYVRDLEIVSFIDYSTMEVETSSLNVGVSEILVKGEKGEKKNSIEVLYVDGIERSRTVVNSTVIKEPVVEQVGVGTYTAKPSSSATKLYGTGEFGWPVDGGYVSDTFISDRNHKGLDIAAPEGTDIYAGREGIVVSAGWNPGGYGYFVMIDHLDGYETVYGHCSALYVTAGQTVTRGQLIAAVGNTGNSFGSHCHFEVRYFGMCYDPASFLNTVDTTDLSD